jgi:HSP20 family protein
MLRSLDSIDVMCYIQTVGPQGTRESSIAKGDTETMTLLTTRRNLTPSFEGLPSLGLFEEMANRFFNEPAGSRPWTPAVDIVENEDELVLTADVPGIRMEDIDIKLEDGTLTLSGSRKFEAENKQGGYHRLERAYGQFQRAFTLPESVDAEKVTASYDNGVLKIVLPKKELAKPRTIKVAVAK